MALLEFTQDFLHHPFFRFWELVLGSILAYCSFANKKIFSFISTDFKSLIGILLIIAGFFLIDEKKSFPGFWALLPTLGTMFLILAGEDSLINKLFFSNRVMTQIGLISYPLYLWHWPLFVLMTLLDFFKSPLAILTTILISFVLAWGTCYGIERPIRKRNDFYSVASLSFAMVALLVIGGFCFKNYFKVRNYSPQYSTVRQAIGDWEFPKGFDSRLEEGHRLYYLKGGGRGAVLFWGDSHLEQYGPRVAEQHQLNKEKAKSVYFFTLQGCPPLPSSYKEKRDCFDAENFVLKLISSYQIDSLVIGGAWFGYFLSGKNVYYEQNEQKFYFDNFKHVEFALSSLARLIKIIKKKGVKVYFVLDNPMGKDFSPKSLISGSRLKTIEVSTIKRVEFDLKQDTLDQYLLDYTRKLGIQVIQPSKFLCENKMCLRMTENNVPIYKDNAHLRPFYIKTFAHFIDDVFI